MRTGTIMELIERHAHECDYATEYGEPGYSSPKAGILFSNWNNVPRYISDALERRGFQLEWSDEWYVSHETGKAYRHSPDSYGWLPYFVMTEDGEIIGGDEIENGDQLDWYVNEYLINDPHRASTFKIDFAALGFTKYNGDFETGFHPGQTDSPREVLKHIQKEMPRHDVVFSIDGQGQFETLWTAWTRPEQVED